MITLLRGLEILEWIGLEAISNKITGPGKQFTITVLNGPNYHLITVVSKEFGEGSIQV